MDIQRSRENRLVEHSPDVAFRPMIHTSAPVVANCRATPSPMPPVAPATTTRWSRVLTLALAAARLEAAISKIKMLSLPCRANAYASPPQSCHAETGNHSHVHPSEARCRRIQVDQAISSSVKRLQRHLRKTRPALEDLLLCLSLALRERGVVKLAASAPKCVSLEGVRAVEGIVLVGANTFDANVDVLLLQPNAMVALEYRVSHDPLRERTKMVIHSSPESHRQPQ